VSERQLKIKVALHALEQQLERCVDELTLGQTMRAVLDAFVSGRISQERPEWLGGNERRPAERGHYYAWPANRRRCWIVYSGSDANGDAVLLAKTCLAPPPGNRKLRSEMARWLEALEDDAA